MLPSRPENLLRSSGSPPTTSSRFCSGSVEPASLRAFEGQEVDVGLPGEYPVTPQIKGAIRAIMGVVLVEEV